MGNENKPNQIRSNENQELKILLESQLGFVVQSEHHSLEYFIRQLSFSTPSLFSKIGPSIKEQKNNPYPNILQLLHIDEINITNMCGSLYRLRLVFQYSLLTLNYEIEERKKFQKYKYFELLDACKIVSGCIRAVEKVQKDIEKYPDLVQGGYLNRVFLHPDRIFIMNSGQIKIVNPLFVSPQDRFQGKSYCYYSPQKLRDFDYEQDEKCVIFQLGICLIHILTLQQCKDIYDGFDVNEDEIDKKIETINQIYNNKMLKNILTLMTRKKRLQRASFIQSMQMVETLEEEIIYKNSFEEELKLNSIEVREVEKKRLQSEESESVENQNFQDWNKQNFFNYSNQNIQQIVEIKQSYWRQKGKQKQESTVKKGKKFTNQNQLNQLPIKQSLIIPPFAMNSNFFKNSSCSAQKQSCVVTSESPFYNLALISSNSKETGKESYQYGRNMQNIIIRNEKIEQMHSQRASFEWRRTKFNKKEPLKDEKLGRKRAIMESIQQISRDKYIKGYESNSKGEQINERWKQIPKTYF